MDNGPLLYDFNSMNDRAKTKTDLVKPNQEYSEARFWVINIGVDWDDYVEKNNA